VDFDYQITSAQKNELSELGLKYGVDLNFHQNSKSVQVKGLERPVSQAVKEIVQMVMKSSTKRYDPPPSSWEPQISNCEIKPVLNGSPEWVQIEQRFHLTLPSVKILQIERIQNLWQWEKYAFQRDRIRRRYDAGNDNFATNGEHFLFHGTRLNHPKLIYDGEDGFDMRYSDGGYWGRGTYFAYNAAYSHSYSFSEGPVRKMFYARVAIGKYFDYGLTQRGDLKKPPDTYDSVSGETAGSKVYMIYENGRAYPEYLITYT